MKASHEVMTRLMKMILSYIKLFYHCQSILDICPSVILEVGGHIHHGNCLNSLNRRNQSLIWQWNFRFYDK